MINSSTDAYYRDLMWSLIDSSTATQSIENYDFRNSRSEIRSKLLYLFRVSFLTALGIYKDYFKSHHTRIQRPWDLLKLLHMYTIGFCNQVLPNLHCWWSEELCNRQHLFKLLKLVMYWDLCKGLATNWRFMHQRKEGYYKIKSNWVLE